MSYQLVPKYIELDDGTFEPIATCTPSQIRQMSRRLRAKARDYHAQATALENVARGVAVIVEDNDQ